MGSINANACAMRANATLAHSHRLKCASAAIRAPRGCAAPKLSPVSALAESSWTAACTSAKRSATLAPVNPAKKIPRESATAHRVTTLLKNCLADSENLALSPSPLARLSAKGSCPAVNTSAPSNATTMSACAAMLPPIGSARVAKRPKSSRVSKRIIRLLNVNSS